MGDQFLMKNITIGQYFPGDSALHRADPRIKILLTIAFMVLTFMVNTLWGYISLTLFTILIIVVSGIPLKYTLKGLKPVLFILIFTSVMNVIYNKSGSVLVNYGFIYITSGGLIEAAKIAARLTLLIIGASFLTLTTTPILLTDGIEKLMTPLKKIGVPAHEIAMMMTIALRFIPTLLEETEKIMKAQSSRGADFDTGNLIQRAKSFIPVLVPLFVSAFRRADELANAMEARCYKGSTGRTRMKQLKLTRVDAQLSFVMLLFAVGVLYLQYM